MAPRATSNSRGENRIWPVYFSSNDNQMRPPNHLRLVDKACAAMVAAVEVYNKPAFLYREETFAILAINAWELLLKAKILKDANNNLRSIRVYEQRKTKSGKLSSKQYVKRNRAGNAQTLSLQACILGLDKALQMPQEVKGNLVAMMSVRDNSVHYVSASAVLTRQVQEVAAASVKNYVVLLKQWFSKQMTSGLHLMLPLSFVAGANEQMHSVVVSPDESRLIEHLQKLASVSSGVASDFAVAVNVRIKLEKSSLASASKVQVSKDIDAIRVALSEQDIRERYPWDYKELCARLKSRFGDFKQDSRFHSVRKPLLADERFATSRYLDPGNTKSAKKDFYSPNIVAVFDKHYTKS
jgi:hypothetical protein